MTSVELYLLTPPSMIAIDSSTLVKGGTMYLILLIPVSSIKLDNIGLLKSAIVKSEKSVLC